MCGEAAVEALRHAGGPGDQQLRLGMLCVIARGGQRVIVEGQQGLGFAANWGVHGWGSMRCWRLRLSRVVAACCNGSLLPATRACSRPPSYGATNSAARPCGCG